MGKPKISYSYTVSGKEARVTIGVDCCVNGFHGCEVPIPLEKTDTASVESLVRDRVEFCVAQHTGIKRNENVFEFVKV